MLTYAKAFFISLLFIFCFDAQAQYVVFKDSSVNVAPGPQYKANNWKQIWWGKHYRKEWLTPNDFPVIDLDLTAGGLTVIKRGGGHQTKSLRLLGANGKEYVLRTIDKSLDILVPEDFRGTFINDIVNDQISTAHPYGPLISAQLAAYAKIYHTKPIIVFVPKNDIFKPFENDFAGKLCLFEERPSGKGWKDDQQFDFADDIINTEELLEELKQHPTRSVDQSEFLKVRLFDMWINDWDRHDDQWVWVAKKDGDKTTYKAFARDRDQSFSKNDGINLYFLSRPWILPSLQNMNDQLDNLIGTSLAARFLDKQFLNQLDENDWKMVIKNLQLQITDEAIRKSVIDALPVNIYKISGEWLIDKLINRREDMLRWGLSYYQILNKQVDIIGTDKKEQFLIEQIDHNTKITIQRINKEGQLLDTVYQHSFRDSITKNIYLYGLNDDDVFKINKLSANQSKIKIIAGEGADKFVSSETETTKQKIDIYDDLSNKVNVPKIFKPHFSNDTLLNNYNRKQFKYDWYAPLIVPNFNPDDGIFLGAGFIYKKQKWGHIPYAWQQSLYFTSAFKTAATSISYHGKFNRIYRNWNLDIPLSYKGPQFIFNFYGFGNETNLQTDEREFNRVRVKQFFANPSITQSFRNNEIRFGLLFETIKIDNQSDRFISSSDANVNQLIFDRNNFLGANFSYSIDKIEPVKFPKRGFGFNSSVEYKNNLSFGYKDFINIQGSFHFLYPLGQLILAHRTGAATNFGDYEFYHANQLGGNTNLRGFFRTRFTGKTSFYQNTEIRLPFENFRSSFLNSRIGVYGFIDDGRVWQENEKSSTLHIGYGAGLFFFPYNITNINIWYARSSELNSIQLKIGFLF